MLWGASDWAKIERVAVVMPARNSKITIVLATRVFGDLIPGDFIEQLRTQTSCPWFGSLEVEKTIVTQEASWVKHSSAWRMWSSRQIGPGRSNPRQLRYQSTKKKEPSP